MSQPQILAPLTQAELDAHWMPETGASAKNSMPW